LSKKKQKKGKEEKPTENIDMFTEEVKLTKEKHKSLNETKDKQGVQKRKKMETVDENIKSDKLKRPKLKEIAKQKPKSDKSNEKKSKETLSSRLNRVKNG